MPVENIPRTTHRVFPDSPDASRGFFEKVGEKLEKETEKIIRGPWVSKFSGHMKSPDASDLKIVLCHGCFDILHAGHLEYFKEAKAHGNILIVTLTADKYVNKGPGRPYFNENVRAEMLRALKIIDHVEIIHDPTAIPAIELFRPDVYFKGQDYADKSKDITGGIIDEEIAVNQYGGKLVFSKSALMSSSHILNRFFIERSPEQTEIIEQVRELGGMNKILEVIADISKLKIMVVGEPIRDTYIFCEPQNLSSKYPCISAKYKKEESYYGGSEAIANHLESFVKKVDRLDYGSSLPTKIRYISEDKQQRIFELTMIEEYSWHWDLIASGILNKEADVNILADFGHGLFNRQVLDACGEIKKFVALNVQTNSSNYGFNPYHKHDRWDYLCLDKREIQMGFQNNKQDPREQAGILSRNSNMNELNHGHIGLTLGSNGAMYYGKGAVCVSPAFADQVVDATGAGDAYFAITSLLVKVNANPILVPFIGNVFAGLKTKIIGNKAAVSKAQLMKALEALLK